MPLVATYSGDHVLLAPPFIVTAHNHVLTRSDTPRAARWRYRTVELLRGEYDAQLAKKPDDWDDEADGEEVA